MKNFRISIIALLFMTTLLFSSGCQMLTDLWPFGGSSTEEQEGIPLPKEDSDLPGVFQDGPVGERAGEWNRRPELKLPVIYFSYDKFLLGAREKNILNQVVAYMKKNPKLGLIVEGHCDERGSDEYNRALGERRALAVKDYLTDAGISQNRIQTQSFGEERPTVQGSTEAAYAKNRRAELILADMQ